MLRNRRGLAAIEILLVGLIILGLAYFFMKTRSHQAENFETQLKASGVKVAPAAANAKAVEDAVQKQMDATVKEQEKQLDKQINGGQ